MAVDTAAKRASAINIRLPWRTAPFPDGTVGSDDRQHLAWMYGGILAFEPAPEPEPEPELPPQLRGPLGSGGQARGGTARYGSVKTERKRKYVEEIKAAPPPQGEPAAQLAADVLARAMDEAEHKQRQKRRNKQVMSLLLQLIAMED